MSIRIAINGFGRIGRSFFRLACKNKNLDFVAVNDLTDAQNLAYLLKYDTVYGHFDKNVKAQKGALVVDNKKIKVLSQKDPAKLPWKKMKIDVVVESTGFFASEEGAAKHLKAGAKRVVISAPAKGEVPTVLVRINEKELKDKPITCNASCTTNAIGPVGAIMSEKPGIKKAVLNTIHAYTATQNLVDGPVRGNDFRRGRAAAANIAPSSTGAALATAKAVKSLAGVFDGIAIRVPAITGSIIDFTFLARRKTSAQEINNIFKRAAKLPKWQNILTVSEEPLVSSDIIGNIHASIVDLSMTRVVDGDLVKILAWYDNEWGYSYTLMEHVLKAGRLVE